MRELVVLSEDEMEQHDEDEHHRDLSNDQCAKAIDKVKKGIEKQAKLSPTGLEGIKNDLVYECFLVY